MRSAPTGKASEVHFEAVSVSLIIAEPAGAGRPIAGVGGGCLVQVQGEAGKPDELLPVERVAEGMKVRGYVGLAPPSTAPGRFALDSAPTPEWFTVSHVSSRPVPICLEFAFEGADGRMILGVGHRLLLGTDGGGCAWREAQDIDRGAVPRLDVAPRA